MKTDDSAEIISALRLVGASYEPEADDGLVGLSGSEPRVDPPVLDRRATREYRYL
jgi:hypothetical protein